jgi:hypothetical protein
MEVERPATCVSLNLVGIDQLVKPTKYWTRQSLSDLIPTLPLYIKPSRVSTVNRISLAGTPKLSAYDSRRNCHHSATKKKVTSKELSHRHCCIIDKKTAEITTYSTTALRGSNGCKLGLPQGHTSDSLHRSRRNAEKHHGSYERLPWTCDEVRRYVITNTELHQIANISTVRVSTSGNSRSGAFAKTAKLNVGISSAARSHCGGREAWRLWSAKMERRFLKRNSTRRGVTRMLWTSYSLVCSFLDQILSMAPHSLEYTKAADTSSISRFDEVTHWISLIINRRSCAHAGRLYSLHASRRRCATDFHQQPAFFEALQSLKLAQYVVLPIPPSLFPFTDQRSS